MPACGATGTLGQGDELAPPTEMKFGWRIGDVCNILLLVKSECQSHTQDPGGAVLRVTAEGDPRLGQTGEQDVVGGKYQNESFIH